MRHGRGIYFNLSHFDIKKTQKKQKRMEKNNKRSNFPKFGLFIINNLKIVGNFNVQT